MKKGIKSLYTRWNVSIILFLRQNIVRKFVYETYSYASMHSSKTKCLTIHCAFKRKK